MGQGDRQMLYLDSKIISFYISTLNKLRDRVVNRVGDLLGVNDKNDAKITTGILLFCCYLLSAAADLHSNLFAVEISFMLKSILKNTEIFVLHVYVKAINMFDYGTSGECRGASIQTGIGFADLSDTYCPFNVFCIVLLQ